MSLIDEIRSEREDLARVLKKHSGIRRIVEDLYPDSAHFIYELLQNAEDAGASEARFFLDKDRLAFEHDGRPFNEGDIRGITDIGEGTKAGDDDKIGRFGVGFKAVFAYSETPMVWSPTFSFQISELVLPHALPSRPEIGSRTRFEFPFNNSKKQPEIAYAEIRSGLASLGELTLLFLRKLFVIRWEADGRLEGEMLRARHSEHHLEILRRREGTPDDSIHFLQFTRPVAGLEGQDVAVAYSLEFLPGTRTFNIAKPISEQLRVTPQVGKVAVFFPAEKESSGLRFHLHAPFVPELSRASVKETSANEPLFEQLASLTAHALHGVQGLGLLTVDFLGVLPNPQDPVPERYQGIRTAIATAMNTQALTPTHDRSHAPASQLIQSRADLKALLDEPDIEVFLNRTRKSWVASPPQRNSMADKFLQGLDIKDWDVDAFAQQLTTSLGEGSRIFAARYVTGPDEKVVAWLGAKSPEWHQQLYALLGAELSDPVSRYRLRDLKLVRLSGGGYGKGSKCFFSKEASQIDPAFPTADLATYATGKSDRQKDAAKKFLEFLGVREIEEADEVQSILQKRYSINGDAPSAETYLNDLKRFVALVNKDGSKSELFKRAYIFEGRDKKWHPASGIYLDEPFLATGLAVFFQTLGERADRQPLSPQYHFEGTYWIPGLVEFARALGAQVQLAIESASVFENPSWSYLAGGGGERWTATSITRDFQIKEFDALTHTPSIEVSILLWSTLRLLPSYPDVMQAAFQRNAKAGARYCESRLVHQLKSAQWIPQNDGETLFFVRPEDALRERLPKGFAFDPGWPWIAKLGFGSSAIKKNVARRALNEAAKELGFRNEAALARAQKFASLPPDDQDRFLATQDRRQVIELPDREPMNLERRQVRVRDAAKDAPEKKSEERSRSVSVGREVVKSDASAYLIQNYTNSDGVLLCQVCKDAMPFKLDSGEYYFETVEFIPSLRHRHYQNYIALCPNHSAMFQFANASKEGLKAGLLQVTGNELDVVLAQRDHTIYFTRMHISDLAAVLEADGLESE